MDNKRARFNYVLLDGYEAGIVLTGPETKAIRGDGVSFGDAYCVIESGEVFIKKLHISVKDGGENEFLRDRKLLLNRKEINKIQRAMKEKGLTLVPTSLYFNKTGLVKVNICLARGKKNYDKREAIRRRDMDRRSE